MDIAIIGFSLELPRASSVESFWQLMLSGERAVSKFPPDRLRLTKLGEANGTSDGVNVPQRAGFLDRDISSFDASFFGMTSEEASGTDPQQRILLETTYRAIENAGLRMESLRGSKTCVFTGSFTMDYLLATAKDPQFAPRYASSGMSNSMLSNRISTVFDLKGPSATIDTACSSSLVALDLACQSIREGQSTMGIVAGSNLLLTPDFFLSLSTLGFLSPDGVCHSFDNKANGYGRGEGFCVVVVKPVNAALQDGDNIRAIIRATGVNQNGMTTLAHPSKELQLQLIDDTYRRAKLDKSRTGFFEAHGTGTAVGDPLEAMAIANAFSPERQSSEPLIVGALKANIGHLEGAAGLAGIIKAVLVLERGIIPPIAALTELNVTIDSEFMKLEFPTAPRPWPRAGLRRASVNSFGFGGTNAHVVLDDAFHYLHERGLRGNHCTFVQDQKCVVPVPERQLKGLLSEEANLPFLFVWSARDKDAVMRMIEAYETHVNKKSGSLNCNTQYLASLAHTLAVRRTLHSWRTFAVASSASALIEQLRVVKISTPSKLSPRLAFVFTGQGSQWCGMGKDLFVFPKFRESLLCADKFLNSIEAEFSVLDMMNTSSGGKSRLDQPRYSQPLCTILQIALVELLHFMNIVPAAVIGHSSGEIAAAYASGSISRESAWKIAYFRGALSSEIAEAPYTDGPHGSMMAVGISQVLLQPYLDDVLQLAEGGELCVACRNSPRSSTISGDRVLVQATQKKLDADGIFTRLIDVPVAYHSRHMLRIAAAYHQSMGDLYAGDQTTYQANMVSSVTGNDITARELLDADYWVRNMVSPVLFSEAIQRVCARSTKKPVKKLDLSHYKSAPISDILEIGPHATLSGPIHDIINEYPALKDHLSYSPTQIRNKPTMNTFLTAIGWLHCRGFEVDLRLAYNPNGDFVRLSSPLPWLPEYPFDRSQKHWCEPRMSRNIRLSPQSHNSILGLPVVDWNPLEPRWRNVVNKSSLPWLEDHKVNGDVIYPAAGMISMAIEAITKASSSGSLIVGYELIDVEFISALKISEEEGGIELFFHMMMMDDPTSRTNSMASFSIFSCCDRGFTQHCKGSVKAVASIQDILERSLHDQGKSDDQPDTKMAEGTYYHMGAFELYQDLCENGYQYGPSFQKIQSIHRIQAGKVQGSVFLKGSGSHIPGSELIIHPTILDAILQVALPAVASSSKNERSTWVPRHISKLDISRSAFQAPGSQDTAQVHASHRFPTARLCAADVYATRPGLGVVLQAEEVEMAMISQFVNQDIHDALPIRSRKLCFDVVYKPDISCMDENQLARFSETAQELTPSPTDLFRLLKLHILTTIYRIQTAVLQTDIAQGLSHLQRQYTWIQRKIETAKSRPPDGIPSNWLEYTDDSKYKDVCDRLEKSSRFGAIHVHFSRHIVHIFKGEIDPLEFLTQDNLLTDYYELANEEVKFFAPLHRYLDSMAHKNPALRILEVGGGTGVTTERILQSLMTETPNGSLCRFLQYDFTDVSPSFVQKAPEKFGHLSQMKYRLLNIEEEVLGQGFEEQYYDIVIAVNVLHTTDVVGGSLRNLAKVMRSGGKLILIELTNPESLIAHSIFGYLPGWWRGTESWRQESPCASVQQWSSELKENGFSGVDYVLNDYPEPENQFADLIISTVKSPFSDPKNVVSEHTKTMLIITSFHHHVGSSLASLVLSESRNKGINAKFFTFSDAVKMKTLKDSLICVVPHQTWPLLKEMPLEEYAMFHHVLKGSTNILWLAEKSRSSMPSLSSHGIIQGLSRTLRTENYSLVFATVSLDTSTCTSTLAKNVYDSIENFLRGANGGYYEPELLQLQDFLSVPRVYENDQLNLDVHEYIHDSAERQTKFCDQNLQLQVRHPGLLESLYFEEVQLLDPLAPTEIEIEVRAFGLNFRDCLISLGRVNQDTMGSECAGVILRTGDNCQLRVGDRVLVTGVGTCRGIFRCNEKVAVRIPEYMTFLEASGLATNFLTAYHGLIVLGRLSAGESVLIHSGAGGTGQAAIQIAKHCGANIFTTVGSQDKSELINRIYDIPIENILHSRDLSFAHVLKRLTHNRGVDVVINSLAGEALVASWECVAPYGRFIEIGKKDIFSRNKLPMYQFGRNVTFSAVDLTAIVADKPDLIQAEFRSLLELFDLKILRMPSPLKVFQLDQVESAFRFLQTGTHTGKIVIEVNPRQIVPAVLKPQIRQKFFPNKTYIIAGGLGAQGQLIARWMVSKGARNLALLSRLGPRDHGLESFIASLESSGASVYCPTCDITDSTALRKTVNHCKSTMPPIGGCIQAAMVIQDAIFDNMSYEAWCKALLPKVCGTWNLHEALPKGLDFFILFSSISGVIGSQGQANYAAGNTYQDELAAYRLSIGEKAVSLNLSMLEGTGYAAENHSEAMKFVKTKHVQPMSKSDVFALLDHYCDKDLEISDLRSQLITGLELPRVVLAKGMDISTWMEEPKFSTLSQIEAPESSLGHEGMAGHAKIDVLGEIAAAEDDQKATSTAAKFIAAKLCRIMSLSQDALDLGQPLSVYGVDSLVAVELRTWLLTTMKVEIAVFQLLGGASVMTLARDVVAKYGHQEGNFSSR